MLASASDLLPNIKIDYKVIELLRKAARRKDVRVTPALIKQLKDVESVDELLNPPSTSTIMEEPTVKPAIVPRQRPKRKAEADLKLASASEDKCSHCGCRMLRVVDPKRPDNERLLECMRATCLATVSYTELPVGTVVGKEPTSDSKYYNSLDRYYPGTGYTPTPEDSDEDSEEQEQRRGANRRAHQSVFESNPRGVFIDVPGQTSRARFLG